MKTLFICWRPYQLMNMINFINNNLEKTKGNSDIIIIAEFNNFQNIYKRLKTLNIFLNIKIIIPSRYSFFKKIIYECFPRYYILDILGEDYKTDYDQIVATGWNRVFRSYAHLLPNNITKILLEDGTGSYLGDMRLFEFTKTRHKIIKYLNLGPQNICISKLFLNNMSVYQSKHWTNIIQMPDLHASIPILDYIFNYIENPLYVKHKIVFLNEPYAFFNQLNIYSEIYNIILLIAKNLADKIVLREHPYNLYEASNNFPQNDNNIYLNDNINNMWELECAHSISDNHILINICSTAAFTPKLLFHKEPYIILLYKLIGMPNSNIVSYDYLTLTLRNLYSNKDKIIVPSSRDELLKTLRDISE